MATKRLGRSALLKYDTAGVGGASATWVTIPFQTDRGMEGSTSTTDGSTVENVGWKADIVTGQSWSLSGTAFFDPGDSTHAAMKAKWMAGTACYVQVDESSIGGSKYEGQAYITKWSVKYPLTGLVSVDIEFAMQGAPTTSSV